MSTLDKSLQAPSGGSCTPTPADSDAVASHATQILFSRVFEGKTFDEAMQEVQALRKARSETLFKLFRLSLCQSAIRELKKHG
jgi:hypothetical protein